MENRAFGAVAIALLLCCAYSAPAATDPLRVLYAEPFQAQPTSTPGAQKPGPANLRVRAFGREFELELADNSRLLRAMSPQTRERIGAVELLKGTIKGVPGSWVRLTLTSGRYSGAFWDGSELYAVAPRETLDTATLVPVAAAPSGIYRLSDTQGGLFDGTCGLDSRKPSAASPTEKFRALVRELQATTAAARAPREIEVSMVGDFELHARLSGAEIATMLDHMNVVDGIFGGQVGVDTIPTDFITFDSDTDPFTAAEASTLLSQFATYREQTDVVRSRGLAHLLTGRQMTGNTIGIAFLGSLCQAREGVSLSESSTFVDSPLIMAHELGHNFGAPHDGEAGSACAGTPGSFLMAPELNGSSTFSACSVQQMQPRINAASCIVASRNREVGVSTPVDTIVAPVSETFDVKFDVASLGDTAAVNVILNVQIPVGSQLLSAGMPGTTCQVEGSNVRCRLPSLAAGASARLTLSMRHPVAAQIDFPAIVSAVGDLNAANNTSTVHVRVMGAKDFDVTAAPATQTVARGTPFEADFEVTAMGIQTLSDMRLQLFIAPVTVLSFTIDNGTCTAPIQFNPPFACELGTMAPGDLRHIHVQLVSDRIEQLFGQVFVFEASNSGFQRSASFVVNNKAVRDVSVTVDPLSRTVAIGTDATWNVNVHSNGVEPVDDVHLQLTAPAAANLSVDGPLGAGCASIAGGLDCAIGTVAAGAITTLTLRARANAPLTTDINLRAIPATPDDIPSNDFNHVRLDARVASEIGLFGRPFMDVDAFEAHTHTLLVTAFTSGALPTRNVQLAIALPQDFTISSAAFGSAQCIVRATAHNLADCAVPQLETDRQTTLIVTYIPNQPGAFDGSVTVTASEDADPSNNILPLHFTVAPNVDGRVIAPATPRVTLGVAADIVFTVAANKYALPNASVFFGRIGDLDEFSAAAPGATCAQGVQGLVCSLGTVAANSTVPVTLHVRGSVPTSVSIAATLSSPAETNFADNQAFVNFPILAPGDVTLSVVEPTGVTVGQQWHLLIDMNVLSQVNEPYVELQFDAAQATFFGSNTGTFCQSPQPPVRCRVAASISADLLTPGTYRADVIFVPRAAGAANITVRVGALNDFNAGNDERVVTVTAASAPPPPPPPPSGGGGGGGGGSMSWLLAVLLLAMWHHRRARLPVRP